MNNYVMNSTCYLQGLHLHDIRTSHALKMRNGLISGGNMSETQREREREREREKEREGCGQAHLGNICVF